MINLRQMTLGQIKAATGDQEVEKVIHDSIDRLQSKNVNGHLIKSYITSMTMSLLNLKKEVLSSSSKQNITKAVETFRKLNRTNN
jgi:hypothetical protein